MRVERGKPSLLTYGTVTVELVSGFEIFEMTHALAERSFDSFSS